MDCPLSFLTISVSCKVLQKKKKKKNIVSHKILARFEVNVYRTLLLCFLFVFVALRPKSTAMVIAGRSVHLTTLFPGQA